MYACVEGLQREESCLEGQTHRLKLSYTLTQQVLINCKSTHVTVERHQVNGIMFQHKKKNNRLFALSQFRAGKIQINQGICHLV